MKLVLIQLSPNIKELSAHQLKLGHTEPVSLKSGINTVLIPLIIHPIHKIELHFQFSLTPELAQQGCLLAGAYYDIDTDTVKALIFNSTSNAINVTSDSTILLATVYETVRLRQTAVSTATH